MKLDEWLKMSVAALSSSGISTARLDAELLLGHCIDHTRTWLHAHPDYELTASEISGTDALLVRRVQREPMAYLLGRKEFYGRDYIVTPDVLIPRPESEMMIESLKKLSVGADASLIDVGTGSGCLGITAKLEMPALSVTLSDISEKALNVARRNAETLHAEVAFVQSDLLADLPASSGAFDVIFANLPYVDATWERSPETRYEPSLALFAENGGVALIEALIAQAPTALQTNGCLLLEADPQQHDHLIDLGKQNGLVAETVIDYIVVLRKR